MTILIPFLMLSGCCSSPKERTIKFEGIENARELGGLVMPDGRTIRAGKLVRSAELSKATDADVALLKSRFDLSDIFDFRFEAERSKALDREIEGVSNTWLSTLPQAFVAAFSSGRADSTVVQSANLLETLSSYAFNPKAQEMAQKLYPAIVLDTLSQKRYGEFLRGGCRRSEMQGTGQRLNVRASAKCQHKRRHQQHKNADRLTAVVFQLSFRQPRESVSVFHNIDPFGRKACPVRNIHYWFYYTHLYTKTTSFRKSVFWDIGFEIIRSAKHC